MAPSARNASTLVVRSDRPVSLSLVCGRPTGNAAGRPRWCPPSGPEGSTRTRRAPGTGRAAAPDNRAGEPVGCRRRQRLYAKVCHIAAAADRIGLQRMRQRSVEPEPEVAWDRRARRCPMETRRHRPARRRRRIAGWTPTCSSPGSPAIRRSRRSGRRRGRRGRRRSNTLRPPGRPQPGSRQLNARTPRFGSSSVSASADDFRHGPHQVSWHHAAAGGECLVLQTRNDHHLAPGDIGHGCRERRRPPPATGMTACSPCRCPRVREIRCARSRGTARARRPRCRPGRWPGPRRTRSPTPWTPSMSSRVPATVPRRWRR